MLAIKNEKATIEVYKNNSLVKVMPNKKAANPYNVGDWGVISNKHRFIMRVWYNDCASGLHPDDVGLIPTARPSSTLIDNKDEHDI